MNLYNTEPEFILAESEKIRLMESLQASSDRNWDQVVVDLEELSKVASEAISSLKDIQGLVLELQRSVRGT